MSQISWGAVWVAVLSTISLPQQRFSPADAASVIEEVWGARALILEDTTPVNFCGVPELFDEAGGLMFDQTQKSARFRSKSECAKVDERLAHLDHRRVLVTSIQNFGDSVRVLGRTHKGDTQIYEVYLVVRLNKSLVFREYRVIGIGQY